MHPIDSNLLLTAGNDRTARLWDVRALGAMTGSSGGSGSLGVGTARGELSCMQHGGVVNSAYFSPLTGRKVLTTCQVLVFYYGLGLRVNLNPSLGVYLLTYCD